MKPIHLASILQTITIILTFSLTVIWLTPTFSEYNRYHQKSKSALESLYNFEETAEWESKSGDMVKVSAGIVYRGDKGFKLVKKGIQRNRPEIEEGRGNKRISTIVLSKTRSDINYDSAFGDVIPGDFAYVQYADGETVPFLKNAWEHRTLSTWTSREVERKTGSIVVLLIFLWTVVSLLLVWSPII